MSDIIAEVEEQILIVPENPPETTIPAADAMIDKVIGGQFRITKVLGAGANGTVFKANQMFLDRPVALKTINQTSAWDKDKLIRFQQEARALAKLNHPNLIAVHQFGVDDDGTPFLVMDYEEGMTLDKLLKIGRLDSKDALDIGIEAAAALQHAHELNILHRDLKPSNMFVNRTPEGAWKVKVIDFGLVKDFSQVGVTHTGDVLGTPHYMSPEAMDGHLSDPRGDVYSLAAVLYECLMLITPYTANSAVELIHKQKNERPPNMTDAGVWPAVRRVIERGLATNRDRRYQSMKEFRIALEQARRNPADTPWRTALFKTNQFLLHTDVNISKIPIQALILVSTFFMIGFMLLCFWMWYQIWDMNDDMHTGAKRSSRQIQVEHNQKWYQSMTDAEKELDDGNLDWAARFYENALRQAKETEPIHRNERVLDSARPLATIYAKQKNQSALDRINREIESIERMQDIAP